MTIPSPAKIYTDHVQAGTLREDPAQRAGIKALEAVYQTLQKRPKHPSSWFRQYLLPSEPAVNGLYLWGGVGTGKTLLMDIFFQSLPAGLAKRIHFHRFMQSVHNQKHRIRHQSDPLKIIAGTLAGKHGVLCLDEFTVTDITDAMILSGLLRYLFEKNMILVATSNTAINQLYLGGLQRERFLCAINLLEKHTTQIRIDSGTDYRMAYLQKDGIYHTPADAKAHQLIRETFQQLAGMYEDSKQQITLSGRTVDVISTGSGVVWFDFQSLCMTNRSQADYIELSKRFHTVIISSIPTLDQDLDDPTRRFIELIDELYDRRVNLIVSASAPPESLYIGKRLAVPFQRTASRLREMSSSDYLADPHLQ